MNLVVLSSLLIFITTPIITRTNGEQGKACPGTCIESDSCITGGGKVVGYCTDGRSCCDLSDRIQESCNAIKQGVKRTFFKSPGYPQHFGGSLTCQFQLNLDPRTVGVRLDFRDLKLPGRYLKFPRSQGVNYRRNSNIIVLKNDSSDAILDGVPEEELDCDSDWFFIKGFSDWMPDPRCGDLTGYSTIIEVDKAQLQRYVTVVFIMSSERYRWDIQFTQITAARVKKMEYCLSLRLEKWCRDFGYNSKNFSSTELNQPGDNLGFLTKMIRTNIDTRSKHYLVKSPWKVEIHHWDSKTLEDVPTINSRLPNPICFGNIVDDRHVLTTSGCFFSRSKIPSPLYPISELKIIIGDRDQFKAEYYEMETVTFHFNFGHWPTPHDNLAMIRTKQKMQFSNLTYPIILESPLDESVNLTRTKNETVPSKVLLGKDMHFNESNCTGNYTGFPHVLQGKYKGLSADHFICLFSEKAIESNEQGSPLVVFDEDGNATLVGLFSHSFSKSNSSNLYLKVSAYWKWIIMSVS